MVSTGYKSMYQQGYSDAMSDFRKKSNNDALDKVRAEIIELRSKQNVGVLECLDIIDKYRSESKMLESEVMI